MADTGEPAKMEDYAALVDRWFETSAHRRGVDRVSYLYRDITERKRAETSLRESEERQAFLLKLSDALRPLSDPLLIQEVACRELSEHLHVDCPSNLAALSATWIFLSRQV